MGFTVLAGESSVPGTNDGKPPSWGGFMGIRDVKGKNIQRLVIDVSEDDPGAA